MDVQFTDSFWKSLKTMNRHQTWWYKTYEFFRYKIPHFIENVWYFRKELWEHRSWDYLYSLTMLKRSLTKLAHTLEFHGWEVEESRMEKVKNIKRVIELIDNMSKDEYTKQAELELGELKNSDWMWTDRDDTPEEREHNVKVFKRSHEIKEAEWKELWKLMKGGKLDGGMRGWWD
jgi:hypothetical protein